jgi:hypothetical protein
MASDHPSSRTVNANTRFTGRRGRCGSIVCQDSDAEQLIELEELVNEVLEDPRDKENGCLRELALRHRSLIITSLADLSLSYPRCELGLPRAARVAPAKQSGSRRCSRPRSCASPPESSKAIGPAAAAIYHSRPALGPILSAWVLGESGDDPARWPDPASRAHSPRSPPTSGRCLIRGRALSGPLLQRGQRRSCPVASED